jgi:phosphonate transport system substrate-binding protein
MFVLCGALGAFVAPTARAQSDAVAPPLAADGSNKGANDFRFGISPFNSAGALLRIHQPLRDFLGKSLKRNVVMFSARDHESFFFNALDDQYDLVIAPIHFVPRIVDHGYVPLVRYRNPLDLMMVVRKSAGIASAEDLRGRRVGLPDRLSLYNIVGMQWLRSLPLKVGVDYELTEYPSHLAEIIAVDADKLDVALTASPTWMQLDPGIRERLTLIDIGYQKMPSMTLLARRKLGKAMIARLYDALEDFARSPEGKKFFAATGYGGFVKATNRDVKKAHQYETLMRQTYGDGPSPAR